MNIVENVQILNITTKYLDSRHQFQTKPGREAYKRQTDLRCYLDIVCSTHAGY